MIVDREKDRLALAGRDMMMERHIDRKSERGKEGGRQTDKAAGGAVEITADS